MGEANRAPAAQKIVIGPQPGPQSLFLATPADIAIYGGAAGGGKTWSLLLEPLRHIDNSQFGAVIFRRTTPEISNEGAIWDESGNLYPALSATSNISSHSWSFPAGSTISFSHLEHEKSKFGWQGSQIPLLGFDELTHFTNSQFWYMLSRNRSMCGVRPYVRATCNPDPDSWVADLISWWINQDTGFPMAERSGVLRYFIRAGDDLVWADSPDELAGYVDPINKEPIKPKSLTFIPSKLADNQALMRRDPDYLATLLALPTVERERLLAGNWKVRYGNAFFDEERLLIDGRPVPYPDLCDGVFAIVDTATKTGKDRDGTAVTYFSLNKRSETPLIILDWDIVQIEGAMLETWLPTVFQNLQALAAKAKARMGAIGTWIEDKSSGMVLLQHARNRSWPAQPIESRLTSLGKDERAISVSGYVYRGRVKISQHAYDKVVTYKESTRNHLLGQINGFRIADKDAAKREDDLLDTFCYGVAIGLGDEEGF